MSTKIAEAAEVMLTVRAGRTVAMYTLERGDLDVALVLPPAPEGGATPAFRPLVHRLKLTGEVTTFTQFAEAPDWRERAILRFRRLMWDRLKAVRS